MARLLAFALTIPFLLTNAATAQQQRVTEPVPTRVTPPPRPSVEVRRAPNAPRVQVVQAPAQAQTQVGVPGARIHYLFDTPENIYLRRDLATFYLPHGLYATVPTDSSAWALEAAHLARTENDKQRLLDLYRFRMGQERKERALSRHDQALASGLNELRRGDYVRAIAALSLAADLDHGDPAARMHLAQARLARGHYEEAAKSVRRALDLQPKLVFVDLELDRYYPAPGTLRKHKDMLENWLRTNRATADAYFLLGYLSYQLGDYDTAHGAFTRVRSVRPGDELTRNFLSVTKP